MDFLDDLKTRSANFRERFDKLQNDIDVTEEACKTSFVLPFIEMLGYDYRNPTEVKPEFTADAVMKKDEKVDYALMKDNHPIIIIECKKIGTPLDEKPTAQLHRYFGVTDAKVGILTDGISYKFFSDFDKPNIMDRSTFFEFNMLDFEDSQANELRKFTKENFNESQTLNEAKELKYTSEIKRLLEREYAKTSDEFVMFVLQKVYDGQKTPNVKKMFRRLTYRAFRQFVSEKISEVFSNAVNQEVTSKMMIPNEYNDNNQDAEFTNDEMQGFLTIKAILGGLVDTQCMNLRQNQRHTSIILCKTPEKDDYGILLFHLYARSSNRIRLSGGKEDIKVKQIEDLFSYTDAIREHVQSKTTNPEANVVRSETADRKMASGDPHGE